MAAVSVLVALPPVPQPARQVTVAPGDDVAAVVAQSPEGFTFIFMPGVYQLQQIRPKNGDVFLGQPGAILSGARLLTTFIREGRFWVATGQSQQGQLNGECVPEHPACIYPEDLFFDDRPLLHVANLSSVVPGAWFFDYPNHKIYFADDPHGHKVETSVARSAFSGPASGVTIRGLIVEKYAVPAQFGAIGDQHPGPNWTVAGNEVRWNHGAGMNIGNGSHATGNHIHHNGQKGLGSSGAKVVVDGNDISFNSWAGYNPSWETGGAKFALTTGLLVTGNSVHDNNGPGLWTDIDNIDTVYENNTVFQNKGPGIQHEISYAAVIKNNVVRFNGVPKTTWLWGGQIMIQNSRDVQVYGNVIDIAADRGNGITIIQQNRGSGAYGPHLAVNNSVHNNTIICRGPWGLSGAIADYESDSMVATGNNKFDYNTYHVTGLAATHWNWAAPKTWLAMHQVMQELHSTVDTVLPPVK
jgi:hypothetical protein